MLHDDQGKVIGTATQVELNFTEPLEVELLVVFRGMQLCAPLGVHNLMVETNCLLAVLTLEEGAILYACHNNMISKILMLKTMFGECKFQYVNMLDNRVAHTFARFAWQMKITTVWWDSIPDFSMSALWIDSNV